MSILEEMNIEKKMTQRLNDDRSKLWTELKTIIN